LCRCLASLAQKWEVLWVERDGDRRFYAILTQNFPMKSARRKKPTKTLAADAAEALRSLGECESGVGPLFQPGPNGNHQDDRAQKFGDPEKDPQWLRISVMIKYLHGL
jgi:hypothetical protein